MKKSNVKKLVWFIILAWIFLMIFLNSCTVTHLSKITMFDPATNYERSWDDSVTAVYLDNFDNVWYDDNGEFKLFANSSTSSRLITKGSFNFTTPFEISLEAKWDITNLALFAPAWAYPVDDNGGFLVREFDVIEGTPWRTIMTAHIGDNGYKDHKVYQKQINVNSGEWNKYRMKVTEWKAKWFLNGKLVHEVDFGKDGIGKHEYYLRICIIMSKTYRDNSLPEIAQMYVRNIKVTEFDFQP